MSQKFILLIPVFGTVLVNLQELRVDVMVNPKVS